MIYILLFINSYLRKLIYLKKVISILLIFLFVFDSFLLMFVYQQVKNELKSEGQEKVEEAIDENQVDIIKFSRNDIRKGTIKLQILENNELVFEDRIYDIYETRYSDDSVFFYCINDLNENNLEGAYSEYIKTNKEKDSEEAALNILPDEFVKIAVIRITENNICNFLLIGYILINESASHQNYSEVLTPPPEHNKS